MTCTERLFGTAATMGNQRAWSQRQRAVARSRTGSDGSNHRADRDHDDKRDYGAKDSDHDYVAIALAVRRAADGEQRNHRTVMRQTVEGARTDHRHAMQQGWIEPYRKSRAPGRSRQARPVRS